MPNQMCASTQFVVLLVSIHQTGMSLLKRFSTRKQNNTKQSSYKPNVMHQHNLVCWFSMYPAHMVEPLRVPLKQGSRTTRKQSSYQTVAIHQHNLWFVGFHVSLHVETLLKHFSNRAELHKINFRPPNQNEIHQLHCGS
jgi:hypothetical protein